MIAPFCYGHKIVPFNGTRTTKSLAHITSKCETLISLLSIAFPLIMRQSVSALAVTVNVLFAALKRYNICTTLCPSSGGSVKDGRFV